MIQEKKAAYNKKSSDAREACDAEQPNAETETPTAGFFAMEIESPNADRQLHHHLLSHFSEETGFLAETSDTITETGKIIDLTWNEA
eukprot:2511884-Rhodomonas_salina.1